MNTHPIHLLGECFDACHERKMPVPEPEELPELQRLGERFLADRPEMDAPAREGVLLRLYGFLHSMYCFYRLRFPFDAEAEPERLRIGYETDVDHCMDGGCYDVTLEHRSLCFSREPVSWEDLAAPFLSGEKESRLPWLARYGVRLPDDSCPVLYDEGKLFLLDPFGLKGVYSFEWEA